VPVGYVVWPIVVGTLYADHGEPSPGAALLRFVFTFEDPADTTGVNRLIVPERRAQLGQQRRDYLKATAADRKATGWSATFVNAAPEPDDCGEIHGDRGYRGRPLPRPLDSTSQPAAHWQRGDVDRRPAAPVARRGPGAELSEQFTNVHGLPYKFWQQRGR
jgi:hypothetical protein